MAFLTKLLIYTERSLKIGYDKNNLIVLLKVSIDD